MEDPHWSRVKAWEEEAAVRSHHELTPLPTPRLSLRCSGRWGYKRNEGGKLNPEGKGVGKDVLVFVFVSHHPNLFQVVISEINFPQVKSVLPVMVTGK